MLEKEYFERLETWKLPMEEVKVMVDEYPPFAKAYMTIAETILSYDDKTAEQFLEQFMSDDCDSAQVKFYRVEYPFAISVFGKLFKELKQRGIVIKDVSFDGENFCAHIDDDLRISFIGIGALLLAGEEDYDEEEQDEFPYMFLWSKKKREPLCTYCMTAIQYEDMMNTFVEKIKEEIV